MRLVLSDPQKFAAVAPICPYGGGDFVTSIAQLKDLPIWLFHVRRTARRIQKNKIRAGSQKNSEELYEQLGGIKTRMLALRFILRRVTVGLDKSHNDPTLYDWFLEHINP